jgi:hypothetical protein
MTTKIVQPVDLENLKERIEEVKPTCLCGKTLRGRSIDMYEHDGGYLTLDDDGTPMKERQWLSVHCDKCGYDYSIVHLIRKLNDSKS